MRKLGGIMLIGTGSENQHRHFIRTGREEGDQFYVTVGIRTFGFQAFIGILFKN